MTGQIVAYVSTGLSPAPPTETKKKKKNLLRVLLVQHGARITA
jgi:hypothetical protein